MNLDDLLRMAVDRSASDLHLVAGAPPIVRVNGKITRTELPTLSCEMTEAFAREIVRPAEYDQFATLHDLDTSYGLSGVSRFRVNLHYQCSTIAISIRLVPFEVPEFEALGVPESVLAMATRGRGLFLVTGSTGSGKSTTMAAIVNYLNRNHELHIITVEDPIEFLHANRRSFVEQREVGKDTGSFLSGLKSALRQDPDVILVGEMRDFETISVAVTAAETGHLVLATLHTLDAVSTVDRIVDIFPSNQQSQVRTQLAECLLGTCSQMLIPRQGGGRALVCEVLASTSAVRNLIREGDTAKIFSQIDLGSRFGMVSFDQSLVTLNRDGVITSEAALKHARNADEMKARLFGE